MKNNRFFKFLNTWGLTLLVETTHTEGREYIHINFLFIWGLITLTFALPWNSTRIRGKSWGFSSWWLRSIIFSFHWGSKRKMVRLPYTSIDWTISSLSIPGSYPVTHLDNSYRATLTVYTDGRKLEALPCIRLGCTRWLVVKFDQSVPWLEASIEDFITVESDRECSIKMKKDETPYQALQRMVSITLRD